MKKIVIVMGVNMTNMLSNGKDDFYRQMFKLTIPIIIQNLLSVLGKIIYRQFMQSRELHFVSQS